MEEKVVFIVILVCYNKFPSLYEVQLNCVATSSNRMNSQKMST